MNERDHLTNLRAALITVDALVLLATWLGLTWLRAHLVPEEVSLALPLSPTLHEVSFDMHAWLALLILPTWLVALARGGAYGDLRVEAPTHLLVRIGRAGLNATLAVVGAFFILHITDFLSRSLFLSFSALAVLSVFAGRRTVGRLVHRRLRASNRWHIAVVGSASRAAPILEAFEAHPSWGLHVVGVVHHPDRPEDSAPYRPLGPVESLADILSREPVDHVLAFPRDLDPDALRAVSEACAAQGVRLSLDADALGLRATRATLDSLGGHHLLTLSSAPADPLGLAVKRLLDVVGALLLGLATAPLVLLVALAIKLEDRGPVLFVQDRVGQAGRRFRMAKFRSMVVGAEALQPAVAHLNEMGGPVFKARGDPRVTRVGAFIRRFSLDELPQLVHVLRGEMSLVGPRPPLPAEVGRYQPWQHRRLSMKPGLTCIWQVSGRNDLDFDTWMRLDLEYIDSWSLGLDLKLLLRTVPAVLLGTGAR